MLGVLLEVYSTSLRSRRNFLLSARQLTSTSETSRCTRTLHFQLNFGPLWCLCIRNMTLQTKSTQIFPVSRTTWHPNSCLTTFLHLFMGPTARTFLGQPPKTGQICGSVILYAYKVAQLLQPPPLDLVTHCFHPT